jgi:hypothetical protein
MVVKAHEGLSGRGRSGKIDLIEREHRRDHMLSLPAITRQVRNPSPKRYRLGASFSCSVNALAQRVLIERRIEIRIKHTVGLRRSCRLRCTRPIQEAERKFLQARLRQLN